MVWLNGNALVSINVVALHRAWLVHGWVTVGRQVNPSRYVTSYPYPLSLAILQYVKNEYQQQQQQPFYGPLIQDNPVEPVLSPMRDLLEQPLDFYESDVLPATQPIVSKH